MDCLLVTTYIFLLVASIKYACSSTTPKTETSSPIYKVTSSWNTGFQGRVRFRVKKEISKGWNFHFKYSGQLSRFECWEANIANAEIAGINSNFRITNKSYNGIIEAGSVFELQFLGHFPRPEVKQKPPPVTVFFQSKLIFRSPKLSQLSPGSVSIQTTTPSSADIVQVLQGFFSSLQTSTKSSPSSGGRENSFFLNLLNNQHSFVEPVDLDQTDSKRSASNNVRNQDSDVPEGSGEPPESSTQQTSSSTTPESIRPVWNVNSKYNYTEVIYKSLLFYEAQRSGRLPQNKRLSWTESSALTDRGALGEDLTGGYYDAGDYIKFGFPMAFSVTLLAWGVIEYWEVYQAIGQLPYAVEALRWGADFFMKAHVSKYTLYGQVGNPAVEHKLWGRPEIIPKKRPAYSITKEKPGSDLAGETSAALSAVSLVLRRLANGKTTSYVSELLKHAEELFDFAKTHRRKYHLSIKAAEKYYKSTSYKDELIWAASWLYRATGKTNYLKWAEGQYQNWGFFVYPSHLTFSWDDKRMGVQMLLSQLSTKFKSRYEAVLLTYCDRIRSKKDKHTSRGLLYLGEWSPLRYAANAAFICLMAADNGLDVSDNRAFSRSQIDYMLGDSGRSYLIGFGKNYPKKPHHRATSCPLRPTYCGQSNLESKEPNPIILEGALVGGPDKNDIFKDNRKNYRQSEVALDHNAGFQGAVAALQYQLMFGDKKISRENEPWFPKSKKQSPVTTTTKPNGAGDSPIVSFKTIILTSAFAFVSIASFSI